MRQIAPERKERLQLPPKTPYLEGEGSRYTYEPTIWAGVFVFTQPADVVAALRRFRTYYDPKTASMLLVGRGGSDPHGDPFRGGFLATIEERHEVLRRLATLEPRARRLLILWHVEGVPVAAIARKLNMSRVHCYRVQRAALAKMLDAEAANESESLTAAR